MNFARKLVFALMVVGAAPVFVGAASVLGASDVAAAVASRVQVQGNQRIEAETIRSYITIKPGKAYGAADVDESIKVLYGTGLFSDVAIRQSGGALVVSVVENPVINSVIFEGNKKVKSNVLVQIVQAKARGVLTDARLEGDVQRIQDYYSRSGRSGAQVQSVVTPLANNRVDVVFQIVEGGRTGVQTITFVGNNAFSNSRLSSVIQTRKTNWLSWLNKRDVYSEEKIQADQELLRRFYLSHGYADFTILGSDAQFDAVAGVYHVTYTVDEGPKYKFGAVDIDSSIAGVDTATLSRVLKIRNGQTFDATDVEKSVENLSIELSRQGYVFAQVRPRGDRDYQSNIINITFVIDEGPRAYVERIEIRGNTKTRDYVIRREFDLSEGDAYNRVLIARAERRLRDLGYFKYVTVSTEPGSAPDKVVLVVMVEDQSTGSFSVAAGLSTSEGVIGEISLEETNFLGRGQTVRISVGGGTKEQNYNLSFTDPYFLGTRVAAGFDAYRNVVSAGTAGRTFGTTTTGGGIRLGFRLTDELDAQLNWKVAHTDTNYGSNDPVCHTSTNVVPCYFAPGGRLTSSLGYVLTYSSLDSRMDPKEGFYARLSQDFAGVGGDARFIRTVGEARYYQPVLPDSDVIGMLKVSAGNITGLGQSVSTADNFFKGGETIRGFAPMGYGPRDTNGDLAVGGKNFVAGTAEVTFPMPLLPPDFGLRGALFADAGVLFGTDNPGGLSIVDDTKIRSSVGASVIWASPFGQIRADLGHALTKESYDKTQFFRLGAGTQF